MGEAKAVKTPAPKQRPEKTLARAAAQVRKRPERPRAAAFPAAATRVLESPGAPLDPPLRRSLEPRAGYDLSRVRIHTDAGAADAASAIGAQAFALGAHVVFGAGRFEPANGRGRRVLAHEIAHVVQQARRPPRLDAPLVAADDAAEREAARFASSLTAPQPREAPRALVQREPTRPRAATGSESIADLERQTGGSTGKVTAGSLARTEWESLFQRHFAEPDAVEGEVESVHPRYLFSRIYGWIDAQHFFAHIQFAEEGGVERATEKGIGIERKQQQVRQLIGPDPDDPTAYSIELESNLMDPETFIHFNETLFIALRLAADRFLDEQQKRLIKGFSDEQFAKLILDNAYSAWSYEDLVSNQLGVQYFRLYGAHVNGGADAQEVRKRFVETIGEFFGRIGVVEDRAEVKRRARRLPGKERWTAPKMTEAQARKRFPELFEFAPRTHRVRIAVYDDQPRAERARVEIQKLVPAARGMTVEAFGSGRVALYTAPASRFESVLLKFLVDRAVPTGAGGALVEAVTAP